MNPKLGNLPPDLGIKVPISQYASAPTIKKKSSECLKIVNHVIVLKTYLVLITKMVKKQIDHFISGFLYTSVLFFSL